MSPIIITLVVLVAIVLLLALWLMASTTGWSSPETTSRTPSLRSTCGFTRQAFNDAAATCNIRREVFPAVTVAGMFGFKQAALLDTSETERAAPQVTFR